MFKKFLLMLPCVLLPALAHGAEATMGDVTLKLPPPSGHCDLDPAQTADNRMISVVTQISGTAGNDLLGISADCGELTDWRTGRRPLIAHMAQYQTQKSRRAGAFTVAEAQSACNEIRTQGEQMNKGVLPSSKEAVAKATKNIEFQDQSIIGVVGDDPNGCYVGLIQKLKAETGAQLVQLNVFFLGSIKEREIYFYVIAPYVGEASVSEVLATQKAAIAAVKSANGL